MPVNLVDIVQHILNIVLLFLILRTLVYKPVRNFMQKREERLEEEREKIKNEMDAAVNVKEQYEASLANMKAEAENALRESVLRADKAAKEITGKAEEEAAVLRKEACEQAEREKRKAMNELKAEATKLSVELASKILKREISIEDNQKIIDEYFSKVG